MLLTTTNIFSGVTPVISLGASSDDASNLTNPDFSVNYTSVSKESMSIDFGATQEINYIAVAGVNIAGNGDGSSRIRVRNGTEVVAITFLKRNHCVVLSFDARTFSDLKIGVFNGTQDQEITVSYVAGGNTLTVPNGGEIAGYNRQWLNRQIKTKTTTDQIAAPIAVLRKRVPVKGTLTLPNMTASFSQDEFQTFIDFAEQDLFFINEDPLLGESSYCCYEIDTRPPQAHAQTRSLNNLSFSFKVFNGL